MLFRTQQQTATRDLFLALEAPVILAYSARNRSASCRIPVTMSPKAARMEIRFPDAWETLI